MTPRRALLLALSALLVTACASKRRGGSRSDRWPFKEVTLSLPLFATDAAFVQATLSTSGILTNMNTPLPCVCDHPQLTCVVQGDMLGGYATLTLNGPAHTWPREAASLGSCQAGGRVLAIAVAPELEGNEAYWHDDTHLVVPVYATDNRAERSWDLPLPAGAPPEAQAMPGVDAVTCSRPEGLPVVRVTARTDAPVTDAPCLAWEGGAASVHVIPMRAVNR